MNNIYEYRDRISINLLLAILLIIVLSVGIWEMNYLLHTMQGGTIKKSSISLNRNMIETKFDKQLYLGDYHVLGSYNSCCDGEFNNVNIKKNTLVKILSSGIRFVDFEVFSIKGKTSVSVSNSDVEFNSKGSYNEISINDICKIINNHAFSNKLNNANDPLYIQFRIKSKHKRVYNDIAKAINEHLQHYLLDPIFAYNSQNQTNRILYQPIQQFKRKIIIIIYEHANSILESTDLYEITNMKLDRTLQRFQTVKSDFESENKQTVIERNKANISVCLPDLNTIQNYDISIPKQLGYTILCMNLQTNDPMLSFAYKMFETDQENAFVMKEKHLQLPKDKPIKPNVEYGTNLPIKETVNILGNNIEISSE